ncbi:MAG: hypothetical protein HPY64_09795 [Anaerolineae bacterium]|nr:hypothetical protein [Anaerolineae bacterium]
MLRIALGAFMVLHGLVHLWPVTLSLGLTEFKPEMGWSGNSWLFTGLLGEPATRALASVAFIVATLVFVLGGVGILVKAGWWRPVLVGAAVISTASLVLFWDGGMQQLVEKGLLGVLINVAILVVLLVFKWPLEETL